MNIYHNLSFWSTCLTEPPLKKNSGFSKNSLVVPPS